MTEPGNFILRWARLKRESDIEHKIDTSQNGSAIEPKEAVLVRPEATVAQPQIDAAPVEPFDPSGLPSIEAITANTDVRGFLQSRVPAELTRAALRQAWTSDPAIRDFIGIAENQWDFNDPNAIPGFGPLGVTGNEPAILTQVLASLERVPTTFSESSTSEWLAPSSVTGPTQSVVHETELQKIAELPSAGTGISCLSNEKRGTGAKTETAAGENHEFFRNRRHHGSALPR
ncbi:MAG TPA: DUF3306 domain-containing protein [Sphingomicrobium sp.]|jgi:hypothetical protein|nr:DUF3306 domain-containing protein [Sphingomicrobium sp.]